jgi:hypothetical protein
MPGMMSASFLKFPKRSRFYRLPEVLTSSGATAFGRHLPDERPDLPTLKQHRSGIG